MEIVIVGSKQIHAKQDAKILALRGMRCVTPALDHTGILRYFAIEILRYGVLEIDHTRNFYNSERWRDIVSGCVYSKQDVHTGRTNRKLRSCMTDTRSHMLS